MLKNVMFPFAALCPELTPREREIFAQVIAARSLPGADDDNYVYRLYWFARAIKATKIVELGATPGTSTLALAFARARNGGTHWSCDIGPIPASELTDFGVSTDGWVRIERMSAADCGRTWAQGLVDLIYLDTSHSLEATIEEIDAWLPHLREGGLFVFHDVESCRGGVFGAIAAAMVKSERNLEYHHFPDCYGHGVLQWFRNERFYPGASDPRDAVIGLSKLMLDAAMDAAGNILATAGQRGR